MMATIEPRLIHLLNTSSTPQPCHASLPPIQTLPLPSDRPLISESGAATHTSDFVASTVHSGIVTAQSLFPIADDSGITGGALYRREDGRLSSETNTAGPLSSYSLRLLLGEQDGEDFNTVNRISEDVPTWFEDASSKKRHRPLTVKEDFVQLPQPIKKQKATQQPQIMPPIINGLHEPPPDAALFPPISSNSFHDADISQPPLLLDFGTTSLDNRSKSKPSSQEQRPTSKARKKTAKPRRKWSEEETTHLLLGVNRHGVGKWTTILEDQEFTFEGRTAGDLKDRFRTCCPTELQRGTMTKATDLPPKLSNNATHHSQKESKCHMESPESRSQTERDDSHGVKQKKSRAHRKKVEDLVELGIHGPFKKSDRRARRPFSDQDDHEILEGLERYGPAWTKIQRDPKYNLLTRQPTDLRDRVRNRYPVIYQRVEKGLLGNVHGDGTRTDILEPSVKTTIGTSLRALNLGYSD